MSLTLTLKQLVGAQISNEELMLRFAETDEKRWLSQLYDNCADDLYHFIVTQSDRVLAKDICQKTWLKVIEKRQLYRPKGQFKAWLFTLGRNLLMDEYRSQNKFSDVDIEQNVETESDNLHTNLEAAFDVALGRLPFEQREAFCLQQEGFGIQDIANICHSNAETIKSRLRYAKTSLRKQLEKHHD